MDVNREFYNHIKNTVFSISDYNIRTIQQLHRGNQKAYGYLIKSKEKTI